MLMQQALSGKDLWLPGKTSSFGEWSQSLQKYAGSRAYQSDKKYWMQQLQYQGQQFPSAAISNDIAYDFIGFELDEPETNLLLKDAHKPFGTVINDLLLCGLGLSLKKVFMIDKAFIDMERHGREVLYPSLDFTRTVGWFTSIFPFFLDVSATTAYNETIIKVKDTIRLVPRNGIGFGILQYVHQDPAFAGFRPEMVFNYLGQLDGASDNQFCTLAQYGTGDNIDPGENRDYKLNISGFILSGKLTMRIDFDKRYFTSEKIDLLARSYKQYLLILLDYCLNYTSSEKTAGDFGYSELSGEDVSMIQNLFN
jgi:non-ribosomal peptide synthase protein (TIGR01720 family)